MESIKDYAIFLLDADGLVKTWNTGAEAIKGYSQDEILEKSFTVFYRPEDLAAGKPYKLLDRARTEGRVEDEGYRVRKDGKLFWADVIITAIKNTKGDVIGFSKITRDLSDRRATEEALRHSEERFRMLVETVKEYAIFMLDPNGHIMTWNAGAERLKGYSEKEIIGKHFSIFYTQEDLNRNHPANELQIVKAQGQYQEEGWRIRKDGSPFWANVTITAIYNSQRDLIGFTKVTRDLTQKRQADIALQLSEQRFRLLVDSVRDYAIYMLDTDGKIVTWNKGAERLKGYSSDEIIGKHFSLFYTPESQQINYPQYELQVARNEGKYEEEGWRVRKDGSRFWANVVITSIEDESGQLLGFSKVTRDLTERRRAEERLKYMNENLELLVEQRTRELLVEKAKADEAKEAAELANKRKDQFLANMCHETFTPMNHILGFAEMIKSEMAGPLSEKQQVYMNNIVDSSKHLHELLQDMLDITKIQEGKLTLYYEDFEVGAVLDEVNALVQELASRYEVHLVYRIEPEVDKISADRRRFKQILINLMTNAIKYNKPNGWVKVSISQSENKQWLMVDVSDSGIGISEEMLPEIFNPFFQVDPSFSRKREGSGLGAAIAKHLVELHQGAIQISSKKDVGTTVKFSLPLVNSN